MAFLRPKSDPNAAFSLTPDVREATVALVTALDVRNRVDDAIAKNANERQAAAERRAYAEAEIERLELDLALEIDGAKIIALEYSADAGRVAAQDAVKAFDRADRLQGALYARAPEADAQIANAQQVFQAAMGTYGRVTNEALAAETREAAQHLVAVLKRGHAMAFAIGNLSQSSGILSDILLPSPAPMEPPIIAGMHADAPDGSRTNLAADWRTDPSASALAEIMKPLTDLRRRLSSHRAFTPPPPPSKPYEVSPANRAAAAHSNAVDAADKARESASPKPSTWTGQARSFDYNPHSSR